MQTARSSRAAFVLAARSGGLPSAARRWRCALAPFQPSLRFPLPWTHYVRLLRVRNAHARAFYGREALAGGWSVRQLDSKISPPLYERTALSKNKVAILLKGEKPKPEDAVSADEEIRNPLVELRVD